MFAKSFHGVSCAYLVEKALSRYSIYKKKFNWMQKNDCLADYYSKQRFFFGEKIGPMVHKKLQKKMKEVSKLAHVIRYIL